VFVREFWRQDFAQMLRYVLYLMIEPASWHVCSRSFAVLPQFQAAGCANLKNISGLCVSILYGACSREADSEQA
jgi:hypothetical protein